VACMYMLNIPDLCFQFIFSLPALFQIMQKLPVIQHKQGIAGPYSLPFFSKYAVCSSLNLGMEPGILSLRPENTIDRNEYPDSNEEQGQEDKETNSYDG